MIRYFLSTISIALLAVTTFAEVPSYLQVCGRRNPNVNKCIQESITKMIPKLRSGIPEFNMPSLEPLKIQKFILADMAEFKATASDAKLYGITNYIINSMETDLEKMQIVVDLNLPEVKVLADYLITARIMVNINQEGPVIINAHNVGAKVLLNYKVVDRKGRQHVYFSNMSVKLFIVDFEADFKTESSDTTILGIINSVLATSKKDIIESMTPNLEKVIAEIFLNASNQLCKNFTYDELFPDSL